MTFSSTLGESELYLTDPSNEELRLDFLGMFTSTYLFQCPVRITKCSFACSRMEPGNYHLRTVFLLGAMRSPIDNTTTQCRGVCANINNKFYYVYLGFLCLLFICSSL
ncbi:hypothetical protein CEXT_469671 [Caerostris extrusa]|uniref:Uncharacterized protein n=1 Tax=Caerostris extrusa TaxID=172846 RepID=A0AAV4VYX6_CAEEX|nr:hypothetical protein CEXT_469671 [Caerostris extrusa]